MPAIALVLVLASASAVAALALNDSGDDDLRATINGVVTMQLTLVYQFKDSHNICTAGPPCPGFPPDLPHAWDHAAGADGLFGTSDDCPHCSAYSAPASIALMASAYGRIGQYVQQDRIYDNGKSVPPEVTGDNDIQTHGVGMFVGTGGQPGEVQDALGWALGVALSVAQHDSSSPMTSALMDQYISTSRPVLWVDHGGWPVNQSSSHPSATDKANQGHVKVIAGYDDKNTVTTDDDMVLVYDPWPEYNKLSILPGNALPGPGGTYDPYWLPLQDVDLSDSADIYLVTSAPVSIPEFGTVMAPVIGTLLVAAVVHRARVKREPA